MSRIYGTGILRSMVIAFTNFLRSPITMQYPHERWVLPDRSRWAVASRFDEAGDPKCRACFLCVRACPDFVLALDMETDPETKDKHINSLSYQVGACMMCGLCVEACPFDALEMSHVYELARIAPDPLEYDLLTDVTAAKASKRAETPATPASAETESADA